MTKKTGQILGGLLFFCCLLTQSFASENEGVLSWRLQILEPATSSVSSLRFVELAATPAERTDALAYLNQQRTASGMISYSANTFLDDSAQNHVVYLVFHNLFGHYEDATNYPELFTGVFPTDRGGHTGYKSSVSENLSAGDDTVSESIDSLFSAIYHRFGFLSFDTNEIGVGVERSGSYAYNSAFGYNMGNSHINTLCEGTSYTGSGGYYSGVCSDSNFRIETNLYLTTQALNQQANPAIVQWPFPDQQDSVPAFYEESPDPLPTCSVSGYPISVQFNPGKSGNIAMTAFKLYDSDNSEIVNTTILTETTDPNSKFSDKEFALFPLQRLGWGSRYRTEFEYTEDGTAKSLSWDFKTRDTPYPYYSISNGSSYNVVSGQTYAFYIPPSDCNDTIIGIGYSGAASVFEVGFVDSNTLYMRLDGADGLSMTVTANKAAGGTNTFTLVLASSGTAILRGDVNGDGVVSLTDAILSLQIISGISVTGLNSNGDTDGNGRTGLAEAISVLQTMADE